MNVQSGQDDQGEIDLPRMAWKRIFLLAAAVASASFALPEQTQSLDFRALHQPLLHQLKESSPAVSALQDTRLSFHKHQKTSENVAVLKAEKFQGASVAAEKMIALSGITISSTRAERRLSTGQINRLNARVDLAKQFMEEYPSAPTLQEEARYLVQQEIEKRKELRDQKVREIQTATGKSIFVYRPEVKKADEPAASAPRNLARNRTAPADPARTVRYPEGIDPLGFDQGPSARRDEWVGTVSLSSGMQEALKRGSLSVSQKYYGETLAEGYFLQDKRTFKIPVDSKDGDLLIQLRNEGGRLLAQSKVPMDTIHGEVQFRLNPIQDFLTLSLAEIDHTKDLDAKLSVDIAMGFDKAQLSSKDDYTYKNTDILAPSNGFAAISGDPKYVPGLHQFVAGEANTLSVMSLATLEDLFSKFDLSRWFVAKKAAIFGRVKWKGQPMTHAVIDLAFRTDEKVNYLPAADEGHLQMTGKTGQFLIADLDSGIEFLRVQQIGLRSFPVMVANIRENLTHLELTMSPQKTVQVLPHELFTPTAVHTLANVLGDEEVFASNDAGELILKGNFLTGQTLLEIDGGENYYLSRLNLNEHAREVSAPLISKQWTLHLQRSGQLDARTLPTFVVGEVTGAAFEVSVRGGSTAPIQVLYFNEDGTVRDEGASGQGGTYLVAGLEPGLHILEFHVLGSEKKILQQVLVDERAIQLASVNLDDL